MGVLITRTVKQRRRGRRVAKTRRMYHRGLRARMGVTKRPIYSFKRFCNLDSILAGADGVDVFKTYTFQLDDLPSFADFTGLYDAYKITGVKLTFYPYFGSGSVFTAQGYGLGSAPTQLRIFSVIDVNGGIAPTTIDEMREYQNCKISQYTRGHKRFLRPKILNLAEIEGNPTPIVQNIGNPWINTEAPTLPYFSLIVGIDTSGVVGSQITQNDILLRCEATYYIKCKTVK